MKKLPVTILFICLLAFVIGSCSTVPPAHLIIQPDPDNVFQGTWEALLTDRIILVVEGTNFTQYGRIGTLGAEWRRISVGKIEKKGNDFYSDDGRWTIEDNILIISSAGGGRNQYERYAE